MTSGARLPSAAAIEPASGSSTWSRIRSNGCRAWAAGSRQVWWTYSAAPWSISHRRPCQTRRFGLRGRPVDVRDQGVEPDDAGGEVRVEARSRPVGEGAGQEVEAEIGPGLRASSSWISRVRLGRRRAPDRARRGRSRGRAAQGARPISPAISSATSALGPWPAPRNFDDVQAVVVGLDQAGSEPPSRRAVT